MNVLFSYPKVGAEHKLDKVSKVGTAGGLELRAELRAVATEKFRRIDRKWPWWSALKWRAGVADEPVCIKKERLDEAEQEYEGWT